MYFLKKKGREEGPYCTGCWDKNKKLVRLHTKRDSFPEEEKVWITHFCPVCEWSQTK
jgi:hypothetical protein